MLSFLPHSSFRKCTAFLLCWSLLMVPAMLHGQDELTEPQLIDQLDSLHKALFKFNFTDTSKNEAPFYAFPQQARDWSTFAREQGFSRARYKAEHLRYLYYRYLNDRVTALQILNQTLEQAQNEQNGLEVARFLYLKGTQHSRYEEYDSALVYYEQSFALGDSLDDLRTKAAAVNAIAVTYAGLLQDEKAVKFYYESLKLAEAGGDTNQVTRVLGNLGVAYARLEQGDSAMLYGLKEREYSQMTSSPTDEWHALLVLVMGSYLTGEYQAAIDYSEELYDKVAPVDEWGYMVTPYLYRSKSWHAMGKNEQALEEAEMSVYIANGVEYTKGLVNGLSWQVELNHKLGHHKEAFDQQKRLHRLQDSLKEVQTNERIDKIAMGFELQESQNKVKSLKKIKDANEAKLRFRNLLIGVSTGLFVCLLLLILIVYRRKVEKQRRAAQESRNELLRSQLNPHFLFNALSSIQLFLINKGEGVLALEYLSKFAKLMRRILENSRVPFVSLEDEVSTLRHYLDLQKIRFDEKFRYRIDIDTERDPGEIMIPPMFAQPFIENSLEHGIADQSDGLIEISLRQSGDLLVFRVEDNGIGITRSSQLKKQGRHRSYAMAITRDRIELLKKQLRKNLSFSVKDRKNEEEQVTGTEVVLELPIKYKLI